jgi:hypothetical protein
MDKESFRQSLHVYMSDSKQVTRDITHSHLFTGYNPLIISMMSTDAQQEFPETCKIIFSRQPLPLNEFYSKKDAIARITLKLIRQQAAGGTKIYHYEGIKGAHRFVASFFQFIIGLYNRLYNKKKGNVFLQGNLYKQVQIAYSLPRTISLITVSNGELYNLFPTDLHGPVNDQYYIDSLRHEGKACQQVVASGKIVISEMHANFFQLVYALGKNHMQELQLAENFPFGALKSAIFQLPVPQLTLVYRELELIDSFTHGIHKILLFKTVSCRKVDKRPVTLAHIHNVYATWRHNKGLGGNYLLR